MKIEGPRQIGQTTPTRRAGGTAASGFTLPSTETAPAAQASGVSAPSALSAVLALQAQGFDTERRRKQVKRGQKVLDALEMLTRAHLDGETPNAARLMLTALQAECEPTGDPVLDEILAEIDVRAAVELAKLEMSAAQ